MPTTPSVLVPVPPSTWPPSSNTSLLRCSSLPETLPRTTRRPESSPDTFCSPSETTRNSTSSSTTPPSLKEVSFPTSADPSPEPSKAVENHPKPFDWFLICIIISSPQKCLDFTKKTTLLTIPQYVFKLSLFYQDGVKVSMPHLYGNCHQANSNPLRTSFLVTQYSFSWQCIYHWLRSNQEYLTCPLCKSGLELSSVRPILMRNEPPEKQQNGIPPRPRPFAKVRQNGRWRDIPKAILSMGMNIQRGVMLAGYGIFPSAYLCLNQNFKAPEMGEDIINQSNFEYKLYKWMTKATYLFVIFMLLLLLIA